MAALVEKYPGVQVLKVEDGPGRRLGRSFRVKLWPNLVFLRDGELRKQLARPDSNVDRFQRLHSVRTSAETRRDAFDDQFRRNVAPS